MKYVIRWSKSTVKTSVPWNSRCGSRIR